MKIGVFGGRRIAVSIFLAAITSMIGVPLHAKFGHSKKDRHDRGGSTLVYSGQAVALRIDGVTQPVAGPIVVSDTGALPPAGGTLEASESDVNIYSGALLLDQASAEVSGIGPEAAAESTLTGYRVEFVVNDGVHTHRALIEAEFIHAAVSASVNRWGRVSLDSNVVVRGLKVNGQPIDVTGAPNQRVDLPEEVGGWLILNEQASAGGGADGDIGVSAIHFFVCHCIEGHIGFVNAGITCQGRPPAPEESKAGKVTGGGWIQGTPSGDKGVFGVSAGVRRGDFWGRLVYLDRGAKLKVKSTRVTGFEVDPADANARLITFEVRINGAPGTATVRVLDKGEPGGDDVFEVALSTGYRAGGDLGGDGRGGGNIQLHKSPRGW